MFKPAITGTMLVLVTLFVLLAAIAYLAFGDNTQVISLQNVRDLSSSDGWSVFEKSVLVAYCVAVIFTYPVQMVPPCRISEKAIWPPAESVSLVENVSVDLPGADQTKLLWKKNAWRSAMTFMIYGVAAVTAKQIDNMVSIIGSIACVPLAYAFPATFHLLVVDRESIADKCIIVFSIIAGLVSLVAALASWAGSPLEV